MAENETKPQEDAPSGSGKKKFMLPAIVAGIMLLEGAAIFGAMKMFGSNPEPAPAAQSIEGLEDDGQPESVEIEVAEFKALNEKSGLTFVVDIRVSARIPADRADEAGQKIAENKATIVDRLTQAVRSADPKHLKEEDLATIRRQMKLELDKILEDEELVEELLITRFQKYRADV